MKTVNNFKKDQKTLAAALSYYLRASEATPRKELAIPEGISPSDARMLRRELREIVKCNAEIALAMQVVECFGLRDVNDKSARKNLKAEIMKRIHYITSDYTPVCRMAAAGAAKAAGAKYVYRAVTWATALELIVNGTWSEDHEAPEIKNPTRCVKGVLSGNWD